MQEEVHGTLDTGCLSCAALYPKIKKMLETIDSGDVFELITHSVASKNDAAAWCRMTKNEIVKTIEEGEKTIFYIKKA